MRISVIGKVCVRTVHDIFACTIEGLLYNVIVSYLWMCKEYALLDILIEADKRTRFQEGHILLNKSNDE